MKRLPEASIELFIDHDPLNTRTPKTPHHPLFSLEASCEHLLKKKKATPVSRTGVAVGVSRRRSTLDPFSE